jgi:hypothetical protein
MLPTMNNTPDLTERYRMDGIAARKSVIPESFEQATHA